MGSQCGRGASAADLRLRVRKHSALAGDAAAILFAARPAALLDAPPVHRPSPSGSCRLAARRPLVLLPRGLTAKAGARCPIWAREARSPEVDARQARLLVGTGLEREWGALPQEAGAGIGGQGGGG